MRRFAVVTGASRGVGAAVCRSFVQRGMFVLGVGGAEPPFRHPSYLHRCLDLSEPFNVYEFFERTFVELVPKVQADEVILVNNSATIAGISELETQPLSSFCRALTLNAAVPIWLMGFVSRCFPARPVRTLNLSSSAAEHAHPGWSSYCAGQSALLMASRVFVAEQLTRARPMAPPRLVICFAPGSIDSMTQQRLRDTNPEVFPRLAKFHRLNDEEPSFSIHEISETIAELVSLNLQRRGRVGSEAGFWNLRYVGQGRVLCLACGRRVSVGDVEHVCMGTEVRADLSERPTPACTFGSDPTAG